MYSEVVMRQQILPCTYPTDNTWILHIIICIIPLNKFDSKSIGLYGRVMLASKRWLSHSSSIFEALKDFAWEFETRTLVSHHSPAPCSQRLQKEYHSENRDDNQKANTMAKKRMCCTLWEKTRIIPLIEYFWTGLLRRLLWLRYGVPSNGRRSETVHNWRDETHLQV